MNKLQKKQKEQKEKDRANLTRWMRELRTATVTYHKSMIAPVLIRHGLLDEDWEYKREDKTAATPAGEDSPKKLWELLGDPPDGSLSGINLSDGEEPGRTGEG